MSQASQQLLEVQRLDSEIARLTGQVKQADAALGDTLQQRAAAYALNQAETAWHARQSDQRDREYELAAIESRIKEHEAQLYSGKGSPRDLRALQRDIDHDKERRGTIEEQALAAMDATEAAQKELDRIKKVAERVLGGAASRLLEVAAGRAQTQSLLERTIAQRAQAVAAVAPADLAQYDRLRVRTGDGIAVVPVVQGRCEGCRTTLPSAEVQRARRTEGLIFCSACGRILNVPPG